jgi:hypothetical protein
MGIASRPSLVVLSTTSTLLITIKLQPHESFSLSAGSCWFERALRSSKANRPLVASGHLWTKRGENSPANQGPSQKPGKHRLLNLLAPKMSESWTRWSENWTSDRSYKDFIGPISFIRRRRSDWLLRLCDSPHATRPCARA